MLGRIFSNEPIEFEFTSSDAMLREAMDELAASQLPDLIAQTQESELKSFFEECAIELELSKGRAEQEQELM